MIAVCLDLQSPSGAHLPRDQGTVENLERPVRHRLGMGRSTALGLAVSAKPEQSAIDTNIWWP